MKDRPTRFLLAAIALALWGLLLRPALTSIPARADNFAGSSAPALVVSGEDVYLTAGNDLYRFDRSLNPKDRTTHDDDGSGRLVYSRH